LSNADKGAVGLIPALELASLTNTWKGIENLENAKELVEEFEKEYGKERKEIRRQESYKERNKY